MPACESSAWLTPSRNSPPDRQYRHSEALFGRALHPYAREAVERGIDSGRFVVPNIDVLLTAVIGAAFALIREILDGRHGPHAERAFAQYMLAALGLTPDEAATVVAKVAASEQA